MYRMRAKMIDMSTKHFSMNFCISTFCKDLSIIFYLKKDSKNTQKATRAVLTFHLYFSCICLWEICQHQHPIMPF